MGDFSLEVLATALTIATIGESGKREQRQKSSTMGVRVTVRLNGNTLDGSVPTGLEKYLKYLVS